MGEQRQETNNLDDSAVLESITSQWWSIRALLRLVSPLALEPVVPHERRAIFAGVVDRVVPPVQAHSLWRHWEQPRIGWYQGAHQRFIRASEGREVLEETLRAADMLPKEATGTASQR